MDSYLKRIRAEYELVILMISTICDRLFKMMIYKVQLSVITPHVCWHTYCTNMAKSGMNPKALQYLMGHSDISVTLNTYTHVNLEDAREEIARLRIV